MLQALRLHTAAAGCCSCAAEQPRVQLGCTVLGTLTARRKLMDLVPATAASCRQADGVAATARLHHDIPCIAAGCCCCCQHMRRCTASVYAYLLHYLPAGLALLVNSNQSQLYCRSPISWLEAAACLECADHAVLTSLLPTAHWQHQRGVVAAGINSGKHTVPCRLAAVQRYLRASCSARHLGELFNAFSALYSSPKQH